MPGHGPKDIADGDPKADSERSPSKGRPPFGVGLADDIPSPTADTGSLESPRPVPRPPGSTISSDRTPIDRPKTLPNRAWPRSMLGEPSIRRETTWPRPRWRASKRSRLPCRSCDPPLVIPAPWTPPGKGAWNSRPSNGQRPRPPELNPSVKIGVAFPFRSVERNRSNHRPQRRRSHGRHQRSSRSPGLRPQKPDLQDRFSQFAQPPNLAEFRAGQAQVARLRSLDTVGKGVGG
jgi:hypothetical protein